jgi:WD40 repeat protein
VLETETGREVASFPELGATHDLSYSRNGQLLAVAVNQGFILIDTKSWKASEPLSKLPISKLALSSGARFLVAANYRGKVTIWDTEKARAMRSFNLTSVSALTLSPDNEHIAVGDEDGRVRIFAVGKMPQRARLQGKAQPDIKFEAQH